MSYTRKEGLASWEALARPPSPLNPAKLAVPAMVMMLPVLAEISLMTALPVSVERRAEGAGGQGRELRTVGVCLGFCCLREDRIHCRKRA